MLDSVRFASLLIGKKSIPRDMLDSVRFASLLFRKEKHTSRYDGFSSFWRSVDWKQKAYLDMCWIQHVHFRKVSDPRPVQG